MLWFFRYPMSCRKPLDEQRSRCKGRYKSKIQKFEDVWYLFHFTHFFFRLSFFPTSFLVLFIPITLSGNMTLYITALHTLMRFFNWYRSMFVFVIRKFAQCSKEYWITFFDFFFRIITGVDHVISSNKARRVL